MGKPTAKRRTRKKPAAQPKPVANIPEEKVQLEIKIPEEKLNQPTSYDGAFQGEKRETPRTIYVERNPQVNKLTIKHVGQTTDVKNKSAAVKFLSRAKELMLYYRGTELLKFVNHEFHTTNPEVIEFIRKSAVFNKELWEGKYPEYYLKKLKHDAMYFERTPIDQKVEYY